jgi:Restriction endonuclease
VETAIRNRYSGCSLLDNEYSWSKFGREAEYVVALYLKSMGWQDVRLSRGSRGPADIVATCKSARWFIQVKASGGVPRLKGYEVKRLVEHAASKDGLPVLSTYQPLGGGFNTGNYSILFYLLDSWQAIDPVEALECEGHTFSRPEARFP